MQNKLTETKKLKGLQGIDHVAITVPDLEAAVQFYATLLGAKEAFRVGPLDTREIDPVNGEDWSQAFFNVPDARFSLVMLELEDGSRLELFQYDRPTDRRLTPPRNCDIGGHHVAFTVKNMAAILAEKDHYGLRFFAGPLEAVGLKIIYVLDPWGNQLELVEHLS